MLSHEGPLAGASLADWPFPYDEIEPFYEKAEWDFGVSGNADANPFGAPRKKDYPNPPHPERVSSRRFAPRRREARLPSVPAAGRDQLARLRRPPAVHVRRRLLRLRLPDPRQGDVALGLHPEGARDREARPPSERRRARDHRRQGRARQSVRYLDEAGKEHEVARQAIVVSGNSIGSSHLLLMSKSGSFPQGLANSSGLVGRNLTFHIVPAVGFTIDEPALGITGINGHVAVDDLHPSDPKRGFIRGGVIGEPNAGTATPMFYWSLTGAGAPMERSWGAPLKIVPEEVPARHPARRRARGPADGVEPRRPRPDGEGPLRPAGAAHHPRPAPERPRDEPLVSAEAPRHRRGGGRHREMDLAGPGLHADRREDADERRTRRALHGHLPHGDRPEDARCSTNGAATHDVPNLWVVDGSCFPTSGGYNPTLTILANAYRVADHFIAEAKRQNLLREARRP